MFYSNFDGSFQKKCHFQARNHCFLSKKRRPTGADTVGESKGSCKMFVSK